MLRKVLNALWLSLFCVPTTFAAETAKKAAAQHSNPLSMLWLPLLLFALLYFMFIRPQSKRQKEQKALLNELGIGDEVMTNAGILGKILRLRDEYIVISVNKEVELTLSKNAVVQVLPKGTIDSIN